MENCCKNHIISYIVTTVFLSDYVYLTLAISIPVALSRSINQALRKYKNNLGKLTNNVRLLWKVGYKKSACFFFINDNVMEFSMSSLRKLYQGVKANAHWNSWLDSLHALFNDKWEYQFVCIFFKMFWLILQTKSCTR